MCFAPVFYFVFVNTFDIKTFGEGIGIAIASSWVINYIFGFVHYFFIRRAKTTPDTNAVDTIAKITTFFFFIGSLIVNLSIPLELSIFWLPVFCISWLADNLIFDVLMAYLGRQKLLRRWFKVRGFYIDHEEEIRMIAPPKA